MRTQLRIVAGSLRGRKLSCTVNPYLRPTPQRVREALFSILGNAVPDRPFLDVFAGTGVVGVEALSRAASSVTFVERDFRLIEELERHLRTFGIEDRSVIERADVYRWIDRWRAPSEPVTIFVSPPFADFARRAEDLMNLMTRLQHKAAPGSVLVLQAESTAELNHLPQQDAWEERRYGRNRLLIWVKDVEAAAAPAAGTEEARERQND
jgi:16S rRNA (guanine(966)-N(2))-methyltransferase RsmD